MLFFLLYFMYVQMRYIPRYRFLVIKFILYIFKTIFDAIVLRVSKEKNITSTQCSK